MPRSLHFVWTTNAVLSLGLLFGSVIEPCGAQEPIEGAAKKVMERTAPETLFNAVKDQPPAAREALYSRLAVAAQKAPLAMRRHLMTGLFHAIPRSRPAFTERLGKQLSLWLLMEEDVEIRKKVRVLLVEEAGRSGLVPFFSALGSSMSSRERTAVAIQRCAHVCSAYAGMADSEAAMKAAWTVMSRLDLTVLAEVEDKSAAHIIQAFGSLAASGAIPVSDQLATLTRCADAATTRLSQQPGASQETFTSLLLLLDKHHQVERRLAHSPGAIVGTLVQAGLYRGADMLFVPEFVRHILREHAARGPRWLAENLHPPLLTCLTTTLLDDPEMYGASAAFRTNLASLLEKQAGRAWGTLIAGKLTTATALEQLRDDPHGVFTVAVLGTLKSKSVPLPDVGRNDILRATSSRLVMLPSRIAWAIVQVSGVKAEAPKSLASYAAAFAKAGR